MKVGGFEGAAESTSNVQEAIMTIVVTAEARSQKERVI